MKIGINGYALASGHRAGIARYLSCMLDNLLAIDQENEYYLFNLPAGAMLSRYANLHILSGPRSPAANTCATLTRFLIGDRGLGRHNISVYWGPAGSLPFFLPENVKRIITVHDATAFLHPSTMAWHTRLVNKLFFRRSIAAATKIVAVSDSTAKDLCRLCPSDAIGDKVSVIYPGIDTRRFGERDRTECRKAVAAKYALADTYMLFVGTLEPRKNLPLLLEVYQRMRTQYGCRHQLVLVGCAGWKTGAIRRTYERLSFREDEVRFLGYVDDDDLPCLYSAADVLVMPSLYEGFGFPALEAAASGTPVVVSDIPVFHEVMGEAALFADPHDAGAVAAAIHRVITDRALADDLRRKGLARSRCFSWERAARALLQTMEEMGRMTAGGAR